MNITRRGTIQFISGEMARKYRRELGKKGQGDGDMRTTLYPLEAPLLPLPWEAVRKWHRTVDGGMLGSYEYFLFTVLLSGFRLFSGRKEAKAWVSNISRSDAEFREAALTCFGTLDPQWVPSEIFMALGKPVREVKKTDGSAKDISFIPAIITREVAARLKVKESSWAYPLLIEAGLQWAARYATWKELNTNATEATTILDTLMKQAGYKGPSIHSAVAQEDGEERWDDAIIAWDPLLPRVEVIDPAIMRYQAVAQAAWVYEREIRAKGTMALEDYVHLHITTDNANGLSWLFGKGLRSWQEASVDDLCIRTVAPREIVERIKIAACAIEDTIGVEAMSGAVYRRAIAGRLDSWITWHVGRMEALRSVKPLGVEVFDMPDLMNEPSWDEFFEKHDTSREELREDLAALLSVQPVLARIVAGMLGEEHLPATEDLRRYEEVRELVNRIVRIRNISRGEHGYDQEHGATRFGRGELQWGEVEMLAELPTLTKYRPHEVTPEEDVKTLGPRLSALFDLRKELAVLAATGEEVLPGIAQREEERNKNYRILSKGEYQMLAVRSLLSQVGKFGRQAPEDIVKRMATFFEKEGVFAPTPDRYQGKKARSAQAVRNGYFYNHQGEIYVSPFARRHDPLPLSMEALTRTDWYDRILELLTSFNDLKRGSMDQAKWYARFQLLVEGLRFKARRTTMELPETMLEACRQAVGARMTLEGNLLSPAKLYRLVRALDAEITELMHCVFRSGYQDRRRFTWTNFTDLGVHFRTEQWKVPEGYIRPNSPYYPSLQPMVNEAGVVTISNLSRKVEHDARMGSILMAAPHEWRVTLPFTGVSATTPITPFEKGALKEKVVQACHSYKLRGGQAQIQDLNRLVHYPQAWSAGEMSLIFERDSLQRVEWNDAGIMVTSTATDERMLVAVPIAFSMQKEKNLTADFKHVVAIDQGERGFGYAVFSLAPSTGVPQPVATGYYHFSGLRGLIKKVRRYRTMGHSLERYQSKVDRSMEFAREVIAGRMRHAIISLMKQYNAIPLLEYEVKNLAHKQLSLLYGAVNDAFLFAGTKTVDAKRASLWGGAKGWSVPGVRRRVRVEGKEASKPLKVFPGAGVNAFDTSRICSCCGGNAYAELRLLRDNKDARITIINKGNGVNLGSGRAVDIRPILSNGHRLDLTEGTITIQDAYRNLDRSVRRAQEDPRSRDTMGSRFTCPYLDCRHEMHADIQAAINIGRKFLASLDWD